MTKFSSLIVALTLSIAIAPATAHADDPFELLGESGNYTLVALAESGSGSAAGFLQLGSAAHVYGHIGGRDRVETAAGVVVEGDSHHGEGGALHGGTVWGSKALLDATTWAELHADAAATVDAAHDLEATLIPGAPTEQCTNAGTAVDSMGSQVLRTDRDDEGLSVYEIDGCLFLGHGETLLIEGTPEDRFVIRVTGGMRLERGSAIQLDGIPGSAVLFSLEGGGWEGEPWAQVTAEDGPDGDGAELSGVFVSPDMYWQLGDGTLMPDTRILAGGAQANIQDMHSTDPITGSPLEDEGDGDGGTGEDGGTGGDDHGCYSDDPCPWGGSPTVEESGPASEATDSTGDSPAAVESESDLASGSAASGCSAGALGASWLWLMGVGLSASRRRRSH